MASGTDARGAGAAARKRGGRRAAAAVGTPATNRNRPLECSAGCDFRVRISRKCLAQGFPACACGAPLWPVELEDVLEFGPAEHPLMWGYARELDKVARGQAPHVASFRGAGSELRAPHDIVTERIRREARAAAERRRLEALAAHAAACRGEGTPVPAGEEEIPF
jgi:hypothetical protein